MPNLNGPMAQFFSESRDLIDNSISDAGIKAKLALFGYSEEKLLAGKALLEEANRLQSLQMKEYGDQMAATSDLNTLWEEAHRVYMNTLKVARVAFNGSARPNREILLYGPRMRSFTGWAEQVRRFYENMLGNSELLDGMMVYGYTEQKLQGEAELMENVYKKHLQQLKEMGEAQEATKIRDKALDELAVYVSNLRAIAKIALSDSPQQLEKLGILARSGGSAPRKR